jgi:hypothetical protein
MRYEEPFEAVLEGIRVRKSHHAILLANKRDVEAIKDELIHRAKGFMAGVVEQVYRNKIVLYNKSTIHIFPATQRYGFNGLDLHGYYMDYDDRSDELFLKSKVRHAQEERTRRGHNL